MAVPGPAQAAPSGYSVELPGLEDKAPKTTTRRQGKENGCHVMRHPATHSAATLSVILICTLCTMTGCSESTDNAPEAEVATSPGGDAAAAGAPEITERLAIAEAMIDAFYSFDPDRLAPLLAGAGEAATRLLYYQGWAEGGNYRIVERGACVAATPTQVRCPVTVEDDPVMALGTDFKVTDTFTITFDGTTISGVETSSNDQPIYYLARDWVRENMPEVMEGPCQGFFEGGPTPGDCARAMTAGYRAFAASDAFPGLDSEPSESAPRATPESAP